MTHRVVVTGFGALTPLGLDSEQTWAAMVAGKSGVGPITLFDAAGFEVTFAAEVKGFDPEAVLGRKEARRTDRFVQFAIAAAEEALRHSGLEVTPELAPKVGVLIGS